MLKVCSRIFLSLAVSSSAAPQLSLAQDLPLPVNSLSIKESYDPAQHSRPGTDPASSLPAIRSYALALTDPPKYSKGFSHFDYASPDAPKGGTFHAAQVGSFDSLSPFLISKGSLQIDLVYDQLLKTPHDDPFTSYPLIAESVEIANDKSYVIFNLNPKARWQDGVAITADDVVFTFETLKNNTKVIPYFRAAYQNVVNAEAVNPQQVKFSLTCDDGLVSPYVLGSMYVLPKHYYKNRVFGQSSLVPPLGSGPYRIGRMLPGQRIVYERVKDYWAQNLPTRRGLYNFDEWIVDYYRDANAMDAAFKAGLFDLIVEQDPSRWSTYDDLPALTRGQLIKAKSHLRGALGSMGFAFNLRRPPFDNRLIREAITLLFDSEWINRNLLRNWARRANSFFPNSELAAKDTPLSSELELLLPWREHIPDQVFKSGFHAPISDGNGYLRQQRRRAFELFRQSGYTIQNGRLVNENGEQLKIEILTGTSDYHNVLLTFITNLRRAGIEADLRQVDSSQFVWRSRVNFDFDMTFMFIASTELPGREQQLAWGSQFAYDRYTNNIPGVQNPAVDHLIQTIARATTRQEVITATRALDRVLNWNFYILPGWYFDEIRYVYWDKFGRADKRAAQGNLREDLGRPAVDAWWVAYD